MKSKPILITALCCSLIGVVYVSSGLYIQAKALLAQYLLQDAWEQTLAGRARVKPWSWADTWPVARLQYAKGKVDLIVLEGASGSSLAFAPGHLQGTVKPGQAGYSVISAHRDTHFGFLKNIVKGDVLTLQDPKGAGHEYEVITTEVVQSHQARLPTLKGNKGLMLVTCYPFNAVRAGGNLRYIVYAEEKPKDIDV